MFGMQIGRMGQTRFATWDQIVATMYQNGQVGGNLSFTDFSKIWQDSAGTTPYTAVEQYVGKIIDKSPNALAFTQATSAARPVDSARVNLLLASETFDNSAWATGKSTGASAVADTTVAPDGTLTADTVTFAASSDYLYQAISGFKATVGKQITLEYKSRVTSRIIAFGGATLAGTDVFSYLDIGGGWYKHTITRTFTATATGTIQIIPRGLVVGAGSYAVWGAHLNYGATITKYQRVNTATDYDTTGFPNYLKLDGIDDNLVSAAGGGGTAGIYFCAAIQFNKVGAVQTIFSDAGTNSGYKLQLTAANQLQISAGNGAAYTTANTTGTFTAGDVALCEFWDDGTNLGVRLGEGTPVTVARPVVTAGTAQITLGKDNNAASNYAGIGMFEPVWRYGAMPNTTQREAIRAICRSKAGIV